MLTLDGTNANDVNIYTINLGSDTTLTVEVKDNRKLYLQHLERARQRRGI